MNCQRISFLLLAVCFGCGVLTGCGSKYQPVTGEIVFIDDGSAVRGLTGGQIIFQKVDNPADKTATSAIDENGKFTLGTDTLGDGAVEGEYTVIITPPQSTGDEQLPAIIDPKYTKPGGSPKKYTVKTGKNHLKVEVEKAR